MPFSRGVPCFVREWYEADQETEPKRERVTEATARGLELGVVAVAIAIVVLVPVVLDLNLILLDPGSAYHTFKFKVLMGFSAILLVAVLGVLVLRRGKPLGVPVLIPALAFLGVSALSALFSEVPWYSLFGDRY